MILAAGYGTRLRPLTDTIPKALVEINGTPLVALVIKKLIAAGVREIVVNLHHYADQIITYLEKNRNFGITIHLSHEQEILGTGGGVLKASEFLKNEIPFILHNVDVVSNIPLVTMLEHHKSNAAMATLALMNRETSRYFIVDEQNKICGHENVTKNLIRLRREPAGETTRKAFCGIHIISPEIFNYMEKSSHFSIVDDYLDVIENGQSISGFPADQYYWKDIGKQETLNEIHTDIKNGIVALENLIH